MLTEYERETFFPAITGLDVTQITADFAQFEPFTPLDWQEQFQTYAWRREDQILAETLTIIDGQKRQQMAGNVLKRGKEFLEGKELLVFLCLLPEPALQTLIKSFV